jgi:hypothetical protein
LAEPKANKSARFRAGPMPGISSSGLLISSFLRRASSAFQRAGTIVPAVNKNGETKLTARNSHQTRRAMADVLAAKIDLPAKEAAHAV